MVFDMFKRSSEGAKRNSTDRPKPPKQRAFSESHITGPIRPIVETPPVPTIGQLWNGDEPTHRTIEDGPSIMSALAQTPADFSPTISALSEILRCCDRWEAGLKIVREAQRQWTVQNERARAQDWIGAAEIAQQHEDMLREAKEIFDGLTAQNVSICLPILWMNASLVDCYLMKCVQEKAFYLQRAGYAGADESQVPPEARDLILSANQKSKKAIACDKTDPLPCLLAGCTAFIMGEYQMAKTFYEMCRTLMNDRVWDYHQAGFDFVLRLSSVNSNIEICTRYITWDRSGRKVKMLSEAQIRGPKSHMMFRIPDWLEQVRRPQAGIFEDAVRKAMQTAEQEKKVGSQPLSSPRETRVRVRQSWVPEMIKYPAGAVVPHTPEPIPETLSASVYKPAPVRAATSASLSEPGPHVPDVTSFASYYEDEDDEDDLIGKELNRKTSSVYSQQEQDQINEEHEASIMNLLKVRPEPPATREQNESLQAQQPSRSNASYTNSNYGLSIIGAYERDSNFPTSDYRATNNAELDEEDDVSEPFVYDSPGVRSKPVPLPTGGRSPAASPPLSPFRNPSVSARWSFVNEETSPRPTSLDIYATTTSPTSSPEPTPTPKATSLQFPVATQATPSQLFPAPKPITTSMRYSAMRPPAVTSASAPTTSFLTKADLKKNEEENPRPKFFKSFKSKK